jgi:hypothetical protein
MADHLLLPLFRHSMGILEMDFGRIFDVTFFGVVFTPSPCAYLALNFCPDQPGIIECSKAKE